MPFRGVHQWLRSTIPPHVLKLSIQKKEQFHTAHFVDDEDRVFATQSVGGYDNPSWESSSTNDCCLDPQDWSTATIRSSPQSLAFRATRVQSSSRGRRDLHWSARGCRRICRMSRERPTVWQCCFRPTKIVRTRKIAGSIAEKFIAVSSTRTWDYGGYHSN